MNNDGQIYRQALSQLLVEIFDGPPGNAAFMLNPGDPGLLAELERIDAAAASARPMPGRTTIASHVDHLHYGLTLLNRWVGGEENPWATADWASSWTRTTVTDPQWRALRDNLKQEARAWQSAVAAATDWDQTAITGALSTAAHTAYHLGAIRQILAALKQ